MWPRTRRPPRPAASLPPTTSARTRASLCREEEHRLSPGHKEAGQQASQTPNCLLKKLLLDVSSKPRAGSSSSSRWPEAAALSRGNESENERGRGKFCDLDKNQDVLSKDSCFDTASIMSEASREGKRKRRGFSRDTGTESDKEKPGQSEKAATAWPPGRGRQRRRTGARVSGQRAESVPGLCHSIPRQLGARRSPPGASVFSG